MMMCSRCKKRPAVVFITSLLFLLGLEKYFVRMLLRIPSRNFPVVLGEMSRLDKM